MFKSLIKDPKLLKALDELGDIHIKFSDKDIAELEAIINGEEPKPKPKPFDGLGLDKVS